MECFEGCLAEYYGAVAVGFEVDSDIEFSRCVVKPFHAGRGAFYG